MKNSINNKITTKDTCRIIRKLSTLNQDTSATQSKALGDLADVLPQTSKGSYFDSKTRTDIHVKLEKIDKIFKLQLQHSLETQLNSRRQSKRVRSFMHLLEQSLAPGAGSTQRPHAPCPRSNSPLGAAHPTGRRAGPAAGDVAAASVDVLGQRDPGWLAQMEAVIHEWEDEARQGPRDPEIKDLLEWLRAETHAALKGQPIVK